MRAKIGTFDDGHGEDDLRQTATKEGDDPDREQDARNREQHVDEAHQDRVQLAADAAGKRRRSSRRWRRP